MKLKMRKFLKKALKIKYLIYNGYDIIDKSKLHEIFNMSDINMKIKYGVSREDLIRDYLGIEKKV